MCVCVCVCVCVCWADLSDDNLVVHFVKHIHSDGVVSTHLQHPVVAGGDGEFKPGEGIIIRTHNQHCLFNPLLTKVMRRDDVYSSTWFRG